MGSLNHRYLILLTSVLLTACSTLERKAAVPSSDLSKAQIAGQASSRYLIATNTGINTFVADVDAMNKKMNKQSQAGKSHYLSLSGGGDNGAFGAGLLVGWTENGTRPAFDLVTGISTGALIAPFAYLGKEYDPVLKEVYTEIKPSDVFKARSFLAGIFSDGLADTSPLLRLISKHVNAEFLQKVAHEYNKNGRWLLIGTTNIDAGTPVIWNMGQIASIGTPESLELFRRILLASASIPGAFPPVMFDFMIDGKEFQEMHVDGGATTQVFLYPSAAATRAKEIGIKRRAERQAYIIRNARLDVDWQETERRTLSIAGRAISQLIQSQGLGDLYRIYNITQDDGVGFNLAYIGADFNFPHREEFDTKYMQALYDYGYQRSRKGYEWSKYPPGYRKSIETDTEIKPELLNTPAKPTKKKAK
jgi:predicted patatin/cPLA2 family phospholipase